jgi:DNA-binding PadR family transcriptional regulator
MPLPLQFLALVTRRLLARIYSQAGAHYVNIDIMKMNSLHYVLLAGIDAAPSSGYDLTLWLANLGQHFWAAEHSSIYPALQQLETAGLVTHREQLGKKGQTRKIYRLSTSGREKLKKWVDEPSANAQVRDEQMVKVLCFDLLSRERITEHLQRIREHHAAKLFFYEDSLQRHRENRSKQVRLGPLLTLHRGILAARAYVQWCDEALLLVARGEHRR